MKYIDEASAESGYETQKRHFMMRTHKPREGISFKIELLKLSAYFALVGLAFYAGMNATDKRNQEYFAASNLADTVMQIAQGPEGFFSPEERTRMLQSLGWKGESDPTAPAFINVTRYDRIQVVNGTEKQKITKQGLEDCLRAYLSDL
jgi:hypothetical protein